MTRHRNVPDERSPSHGAASPKDTEMSSPHHEAERADENGMATSESPSDSYAQKEFELRNLLREALNDTELERGVRRAIDPRHPTLSRTGILLAEWRRAGTGRPATKLQPMHTPMKDMTDAELNQAFPSIGKPPSKPLLSKWEEHQVRRARDRGQSTPTKQGQHRASSEMGLFGTLPGELRNYVYRLAFVPPADGQPVLIEGSDLICGRSKCIHRSSPIAAPGIASSCRQIRQELMPIYTAENSFKFDAVMVRNRCPASWIRAISTYAAFIPKVTLEVQILTRTPTGTTSIMSDIVLECPAGRGDGRFELTFGAEIPEEKVEISGLEDYVESINDGHARWSASKLGYILGSDELAELVYRCRK
ncbi:hypothetical protein Tdes44962_MAKER03704 [Teratosphaeria destructans]|uniref:Uncharacterized protein n=1 Tax=Teratosphaeria destructans TaxID=418781 RepID=A0A9W7SP49_9PEZI|nr:hypothetical protein Tdes44962_MAKER03704 [Teratosphaeria destructans]